MTYHFEINNKPNKQGRFSILLRVTENRKSKRVQTSISLSKIKDWNRETEQVRKSEPYAVVWNDALQEFVERAKRIERSLTDDESTPTLEQVVSRLKDRGEKDTLLEFMQGVMSSQAQSKQWGSRDKYGDCFNKLQSFLMKQGLTDIAIKDVTPTFVDDYRAYLNTLPNYRDKLKTLSPNTIKKHLRTLRAVLNRAVVNGVIKAEQVPANLCKLADSQSSVYGLQQAELEKIWALELQAGSTLWNARNMYQFAIFACGIRIGDLLELRWANVANGRLSYQMRKVEKNIDVNLPQDAIDLLNLYKVEGVKETDYIFPFLQSGAGYAKYVTADERKMMPAELSKELYSAISCKERRLNIALAQLAEMAGVQKFTFHSSRHTFAIMANEAGVDTYTIKNLLNHQSLRTSQGYMQRLDHTREDEAVQKIFSASTEGKADRAKELVEQLRGMGLSAKDVQELMGNPL